MIVLLAAAMCITWWPDFGLALLQDKNDGYGI
jgi:hypothetical protein